MATADGKKTGGRKKGTVNKKTKEVIDKLNDLGCDPIEGLAKIAMESDEESLRLQANKELAQYIAPKRKAVEHSGVNDEPIKHETKISFIGKSKDD